MADMISWLIIVAIIGFVWWKKYQKKQQTLEEAVRMIEQLVKDFDDHYPFPPGKKNIWRNMVLIESAIFALIIFHYVMLLDGKSSYKDKLLEQVINIWLDKLVKVYHLSNTLYNKRIVVEYIDINYDKYQPVLKKIIHNKTTSYELYDVFLECLVDNIDCQSVILPQDKINILRLKQVYEYMSISTEFLMEQDYLRRCRDNAILANQCQDIIQRAEFVHKVTVNFINGCFEYRQRNGYFLNKV